MTKVAKHIEQVQATIARYLAMLDDATAEGKTVRPGRRLEGLQRQMQSLKEMSKQVEAAPNVSLTDPGARSMATSGEGTGIVAYNVQKAVYAEHHLMGAHEASDRAQLTSMGQKAQDATGSKR